MIALVAKLERTGREKRMKEKGQLEGSCSVPKRAVDGLNYVIAVEIEDKWI